MSKRLYCLFFSLFILIPPITSHAKKYTRLLAVPYDLSPEQGIATIKAVVAQRRWKIVSVDKDAVTVQFNKDEIDAHLELKIGNGAVSYHCVCTSYSEQPVGLEAYGKRDKLKTSRSMPRHWVSSLQSDLRSAFLPTLPDQRPTVVSDGTADSAAPMRQRTPDLRIPEWNLEERLRRLNRLLSEKLITQDEYDRKRAEILDEL